MYYHNTEGNDPRNIFAPRIKSPDYCLFEAQTYIIHSVILKTPIVIFLLLLSLFLGAFNSGTKGLSKNANHLTWYSIKDMDCSGFYSTNRNMKKTVELKECLFLWCISDCWEVPTPTLTPLFSQSAFEEHEASTIPVFYFCGIVTWQFSFRRSDPPSEWYQPIDVLFRSWVRVLQSGGKFAHIQVEVWEILSQRFMWSWLVKCGTNQCMDNHKKQVCIGTGTRCVVYFVNVWGEKKVISKWPNSESCWHRTSPKVGHF